PAPGTPLKEKPVEKKTPESAIPAEKPQPGAKVIPLPGGGIQIFFDEFGQGEKEKATETLQKARQQLEEAVKRQQREAAMQRDQAAQAYQKARQAMEEAMKQQQATAMARMRDRIKRQQNLAEKAWNTYQKMEK